MSTSKPFKIETFLFNTPLYEEVKLKIKDSSFQLTIIDEENDLSDQREFDKLFFSQTRFEGINPDHNDEDTTYLLIKPFSEDKESIFLNDGKIFETLIIQCIRYDTEYVFHIAFDIERLTILKIGQYPSLADFHTKDLTKYKDSILPAKYRKEFYKAIGLAAHGVGIGSFVYLRRIFEHLIYEIYYELKKDNLIAISETDFKVSKIDVKIEQLKDHLPKFLVDNKRIYGMLSVGIHQLDEETCLEMFAPLREGIKLILDQRVEQLEKKKSEKQLTSAIESLNKKLNS